MDVLTGSEADSDDNGDRGEGIRALWWDAEAVISAILLFASIMPAPEHVAALSCGAGTFTLTSRGFPDTLAPASQSLTVRVAGRHRAVPLETTGLVTVDGRRVRNRYVLTWACTKGARGVSYVSLGYACAVDPGYPHDCGGEKEWFRLLDERGQPVDLGVPHSGPAMTRLHRRLGLLEQFEKGTQMTDVLE